MSKIRTVIESPRYQGVDETITYLFDWSDVGTPTTHAVILKNREGTDVSATCLVGVSSIVSDYVVTPVVGSLIAGEEYRMECKATIAGNVLERVCIIIGET
jgi:hypothetical protein